MNFRPCRSGDKNDQRQLRLDGVASLPDGTTAQAFVSRSGQDTSELAVTVDDAALRLVTVNLGAGDSDWLPAEPRLGSWSIELLLTFPDGSELTWPDDAPDTIDVGARRRV